MAGVVHCLYMRGIIEEQTMKHVPTRERFDHVTSLFPDLEENLPRQKFDKVASRLDRMFRRKWHGTVDKQDFLKRFKRRPMEEAQSERES